MAQPTYTQEQKLDLIGVFFQTVELLGQHSKEVLELNEPFFSVGRNVKRHLNQKQDNLKIVQIK
jgi:hypothetical protein